MRWADHSGFVLGLGGGGRDLAVGAFHLGGAAADRAQKIGLGGDTLRDILDASGDVGGIDAQFAACDGECADKFVQLILRAARGGRGVNASRHGVPQIVNFGLFSDF